MARQADQDQIPLDWVTVSLICALYEELAACMKMLDHEICKITPKGDENIYHIGKIQDHYVVVACLPATKSNTDSTAAVARDLKRSFNSIRFGLLVGVGGGNPSDEADIRLGDVVVSQPEENHGGVIYYDFGKITENGFEPKQHLNKPPDLLLNALTNTKPKMVEFLYLIDDHMKSMGFAKPPAKDRLLRGDKEVPRDERKNPNPRIHYGLIASGNKVVRKESFRDGLSDPGRKILCIEMEAAGLMDRFPCLVIRGIADYADKHKNDLWKNWAAACAAAYAKELLLMIPADRVQGLHPIQGSFVVELLPIDRQGRES